MTLSVRPISLNAARAWIASCHRHLRRPTRNPQPCRPRSACPRQRPQPARKALVLSWLSELCMLGETYGLATARLWHERIRPDQVANPGSASPTHERTES